MSNMDRKTALEVLKDYQYWRRYDGPITDSPQMQDPKIIGLAIDVAIEALQESNKPMKEDYGG